jgi:UDP-glucose 4-epimerase
MEKGHDVKCIDNFSSGKIEFIEKSIENGLELIKGDILHKNDLKIAVEGCDTVFHLAANPDVRLGAENTSVHFEQNILATYTLLEESRKQGIKKIIFTSSSTVYGEADVIPTSETYAPLIPISLYGASKLAAESLICAYCHTFDISSVLYRFANVVGPKSTHGVTYDFIKKLKKNPNKLEILGDGTQKKSYLYIADCIDAMLFGMNKSKDKVEIFNIGSLDWVDVKTIADIVSEEMKVHPTFEFTGGIDGGRGWKGDVKMMKLSIEKLMNLGWKPRFNSEEALRKTAKWLLSCL